MRTKNNKTRSNKAIRMINHFNATWEEVAEALGLSVGTIQSICKKHYKSPKCYNNLLAKARANKKAKAEVNKIIEEEVIKEVIVVETGFLMVNGIPTVDLDIYMPNFCIRELDKLSNTHKVAKDILMSYWSTKDITTIKLHDEVLYEDPQTPVKDRSIGVVAVCTELDSLGYKVRLYTNSREIEELANLQDCGINVIRVSK